MPRLVVDADVARIDVDRVAPAIPVIISRLRGLRFDPDGVVDVETLGRREGLQVISGTPGRVGSRYRMMTAPDATSAGDPERQLDAPVEIELVTDDPGRLELALRGDGQHGSLVVDQSIGAEKIRLTGDIAIPDLPAILGGRTTRVIMEIRLAGFAGSLTPQAELDATLGRVQVRVGLHLVPGPGRTDRVRLELEVRLRGLLRPATLLWPFVRSRVVAAARTELTEVLGAIAADVDQLLAGGPDPSVVADRAVAQWATSLVEHLPAGPPLTDPGAPASPRSPDQDPGR